MDTMHLANKVINRTLVPEFMQCCSMHCRVEAVADMSVYLVFWSCTNKGFNSGRKCLPTVRIQCWLAG